MPIENEIELSTPVPPRTPSSSDPKEVATPLLPRRVSDPASEEGAPPALAELFHVDAESRRQLAAYRAVAARERIQVETAPAPALAIGKRISRILVFGVPRTFVVALLVWGLCFNFSEVRGSSMEPGIHDHDRIVVDHVSYLLHEVERGDIVILRYPLDPTVDYIKRIIGVPGDEIVLAGGKLWVNGTLIDEPYVDAAAIDPYTHVRTVVESQHYFVLGDNRMRSSDSREFGQVSRELLRGKVQVRIWPIARLGWIH